MAYVVRRRGQHHRQQLQGAEGAPEAGLPQQQRPQPLHHVGRVRPVVVRVPPVPSLQPLQQ